MKKKGYEPLNYKTIKEFFYDSCNKFGDNVVVYEKHKHDKPFEGTTYSQFQKDVNAFSAALIEKLKLKNSRIVLIGKTEYDWYLSYMTMLCSGILVIPTDKELPVNEIENIVKRSKADVVIYSDVVKEKIEKLKENQKIKYFIQTKSDKKLEGKDVGINHLLKLGNEIIEKTGFSAENIEVDPEEFKILLFTSGTTSNSKGVMLNNRNLAENVNVIPAYVKLYDYDKMFSVLPLHHTYESTIGFLYPISIGASIVVCEGLRYIADNIKETKPSAMLSVPLLVENVYKKIIQGIKKEKKERLVNFLIAVTNFLEKFNIKIKRKVFKKILDNLGGNLRILVSAAAPMDKKIAKWFRGIGIEFLQGYGLTETAPIAALTPEFKPTVGSVGKAVVRADIKIDNPNEKGEGEILIKSPTLMIGYYEDEEKTKEVMTEDNYFRSGDVGYMDKNGFIFITGRIKNVIVTQNGKNIYPEELELCLSKVHEISECFVYGKEPESLEKHDKNELIITAKLIPNYEYIEEHYGKKNIEEIKEIIWKKIKEDVNKKLVNYKTIKQIEIKEGEFEKTSTMKIKRYKELKKM